jgi:hypothetical protein
MAENWLEMVVKCSFISRKFWFTVSREGKKLSLFCLFLLWKDGIILAGNHIQDIVDISSSYSIYWVQIISGGAYLFEFFVLCDSLDFNFFLWF